MDGESDASDTETAPELPLYARFLSHLSYCKVAHDDCWEPVPADALWEQFKAWAKSRNHKVKFTATDFTTMLNDLASPTQDAEQKDTSDSGLRKYRQEKQLFFALHPVKLQNRLRERSLLDTDAF
eukprot:3597349-Rhodomonas_salina.1